MSQFYKAEMARAEINRYCDVLALPMEKRWKVAVHAEETMHRYLNLNSATRWEYEEAKREHYLYSRTDEQLKDLIYHHKMVEKSEMLNELERCRRWLIEAFRVGRMAKSGIAPEHNLKCARQWITVRWPEYKAARKAVWGF